MSVESIQIAKQLIKDNISAFERGEKSAFELDLGKLEIEDIERDIPELKDCVWLQKLILIDNQISEIKNLDSLIYLQQLYLNHNRINKIDNLYNLTNLQQFDLSNNQISEIKNLDNLTNLQQLYLSYNQISEIKNLDNLTNLQQLYLSYNQISEIKNLDNLTNLQTLHLTKNQISEIKNLDNLTNLQTLHLLINQISEIKNLDNLTNLQDLNLYRNQIQEIKNLNKLVNLHQLCLRGNQINHVKNLEYLTNLQQLDLNNNQISKIEKIPILTNLQKLDLSNNQITSLSTLLPFLKTSQLNIKSNDYGGGNIINIYGNQITNPPFEVVKQGKLAIIHYLEELEMNGSEKLYEAKVLVLGNGEAGKTTLISKLTKGINTEMPTIDYRTRGIDITQLSFIQDKNNHIAHLWDFGGQQIYHATHQFFLTHRSVYVLVTDSRKDDTDFYYWLQVIGLLSANSPVVILSNRKDDTYNKLPESDLHKHYGNIKGFYYLNLKYDENELAKFLKTIQYEVSNLPQMGEEVPKPMIQVRNRLDILRIQGKKHIGLYDYYTICKEEGLEQERADYYSQLLHDLGLLLHFQKDVVLKHTVFLDNEWITDAVYAVLDDEQIKVKQKGCFSEADAKGLWQASYSPMWQELLALMGKFELCYELPNKKGHYIAPQLLDVERTAAAAAWQLSDSLQLRYQYEFMPKGMVSRLIVRLHRYIADVQHSAWKTGAILKDKVTGAELLMYEVYGKKEIYLSAKGVFAKDLLAVVSAEVDELNGTYENIKVNKLVPCICKQCKGKDEPHFFDYKNLIERKMDGKPTIECQRRPYDNVQVNDLLDSVGGNTVTNQLAELEKLVSSARLDKALELLLSLMPKDERHVVIGLQAQLSTLEQKEVSGTIANDDANLERNKIIKAIFNIASGL